MQYKYKQEETENKKTLLGFSALWGLSLKPLILRGNFPQSLPGLFLLACKCTDEVLALSCRPDNQRHSFHPTEE